MSDPFTTESRIARFLTTFAFLLCIGGAVIWIDRAGEPNQLAWLACYAIAAASMLGSRAYFSTVSPGRYAHAGANASRSAVSTTAATIRPVARRAGPAVVALLVVTSTAGGLALVGTQSLGVDQYSSAKAITAADSGNYTVLADFESGSYNFRTNSDGSVSVQSGDAPQGEYYTNFDAASQYFNANIDFPQKKQFDNVEFKVRVLESRVQFDFGTQSDSGNYEGAEFLFQRGENVTRPAGGGGSHSLGFKYPNSTEWHTVRLENINYSAPNFDLVLIGPDGTKIGEKEDVGVMYNWGLSSMSGVAVSATTSSTHAQVDYFIANSSSPVAPSKPDLNGTVENQNGQPVPNATVTITGIDREQIDADPGHIDERINEIQEQITNPEPPNFSTDTQLTGGDGLFSDASTEYVAAHPKGDWGLTAYTDEPQLGNPRVQLPANEQIALSVWDPSTRGLVQDGATSDLPGGIVDDTNIVVESIDHAGGTVDRQTYETDTTYDVGPLGGSHDLATVSLPAGFYRVYPEDSPETSYVIVVGDPDAIVASIEEDLRNEAGQLTDQAERVRDYMDRDVLKQYETTTNSDGEWSIDVPDSITRVRVQAHKAPPGLDQDPQNTSLQDVREFYSMTEYNGSYVMPAEAATYSVRSNNITVDVVETEAPLFADLAKFRNASERFQNRLQNLSYSELPSSLQQRLEELERPELENTAEKLQQLTNENSQLEARVEELMDRDLIELDINDSTNAELRKQIQAQQQAISELRSTIEAGETTTEVADGVASSTATFAEALSEDQVRVVANFPNGTSREVPSEHLTLEQSAGTLIGQGGTQVAVEDYPLGDAEGVTFDYAVVTEDGIGETSTQAGTSSIGLDAISLSSLRPGPDEQVDVTLVGDDETQIANITAVRAVAPDGSELSTSTADADTVTFQTSGEGRHYVEVTFESASGEQGTLTHRIQAGDTDQAMPPGIRIKDTPFGTLAVVGDGFQSGSVDTSQGSTQIDIQAQIGADADTPARTHLYAHATDLPPSANLKVNIVRGENQRAVQRHVEVTAHLPAVTSETSTLYRGDSALPREGEGQIASVTTSPDETTIVTVTDASGSLQLQTNSNPGIVERANWWIDRNTPDITLGVLGQLPAAPTTPLDASWVLRWVGPVQAPAPTIDTTVPVPA